MRLSICSLLAVLLSFSLLACNRKSTPGIEVNSKLKGYILPNSKILAGVDLDKLKQSDFYKRHQSQLAIPQLDDFSRQMGVDPRRDLSSLVVSWNGTGALAMTSGTFDPTTLQKRLTTSVQSEKYNKFTLFGDSKRDVVFLPKSIALLGPPDLLKKAIEVDATGAGGIPEGLQVQLAQLNKGAQAWLVSNGVISLNQLPLRSDTAMTLSNISDYVNAMAVGVTLTSGGALDAHLSCVSEEGSQRVHDALRGVIGLGRLSTKDDQLDQLKVWDSIKVDKQGKDVHITAELTPELVDKVMSTIPALTNRF